MARKYRKLGLRRDKNLADLDNKSTALSNVLNSLAAPGETFLTSDINVIKNLRNTKVVNTNFGEIKNLKLTYLDEENTEKTLTPLVRLEDRIENYKVVTGTPPYLVGGDGLKAKFIPSQNISANIGPTTTGANIFNTLASVPYFGPITFWDDGSFEFQSLIYPDFQDSYGMVQWEGFFAPAAGDQSVTIRHFTTGLLLIEQDPFNNGSWETLKSIYNTRRPITFTVATAQTAVTVITIGTNTKYVTIGDKLENQNIFVTDVNVSSGTITLDTPINLTAGSNTLTFVFDLGQTESVGFIRLRTSFTNDKIKLRITVWWPDPADPSIVYGSKTLRLFYPNSIVNTGNQDALTYVFMYSEYSRSFETQNLSVEYFLKNYLSSTNTKTNYDMNIKSNVFINYSPPLLPVNRWTNTAIQSFTFTGSGKVELSNAFVDVSKGDFFIRRSTYTKTYLIEEKGNDSAVYIDPINDIVPAVGNTFNGFVIKNSGLVGVYNIINNRISPLTDNDFSISLVRETQFLATIDSATNQIRGFFRILSYNYLTGNLVLQTLTNVGETPATNGIAVIYRSASLEDLSKLQYCTGVIGKEVNQISAVTSTTIYLKDTVGIVPNLYVQLEGFLPTTAQVNTVGVDANGPFITLTGGAVLLQIDKDVTITFSPDAVNREICIIPLNTAPPFAGTATGLTTQTGNEALFVNRVTANNLILKSTVATETVDRTVGKSLQFVSNGQIYRFLIK